MEKPKLLKFKKIPTKDKLLIGCGFISNKHWMLKIDWVLSLKPSREFGNIGLINRFKKETVSYVSKKLQGDADAVDHAGIKRLIESTDVSAFKPLDMTKAYFTKGYAHGNPDNFTEVKMQFSEKNSPCLDIEYAAALFFDSEVTPYFNKINDYILLLKGNEVVGYIMPIMQKQENN